MKGSRKIAESWEYLNPAWTCRISFDVASWGLLTRTYLTYPGLCGVVWVSRKSDLPGLVALHVDCLNQRTPKFELVSETWLSTRNMEAMKH